MSQYLELKEFSTILLKDTPSFLGHINPKSPVLV